MTAVVGSFCLAVALFASVASALLWFQAARRRADAGLARLATLLLLLGTGGACLALETALVRNDFSIAFVAENSSTETPLPYRISALWSALDGSLLLWVLVLSLYAVLVARRRPRRHGDTDTDATPLQPYAAAVVSAVAAGFVGLTIGGAHPFARSVPAPLDGAGPNPLLADHPAMMIHPPLLYLGYVGLVVPFAYALAALIRGDAGTQWLETTRLWVLAAWVCLTAGIVLGAWWSYAVLGWGGYWAWDPVENASLLPWLTATALLHSALVQRRRRTLQWWNVTLAAASFLLVCTGTFLTRSGVVASVHSFSPSALGPLLLAFLGICVAAVIGLLIWRGDLLDGGVPEGPGAAGDTGSGSEPVRFSRETALTLNNLVLIVLAAVVLLGTVAPALLLAVGGADVSVGEPFYNRVAVPAALVLLVLMVLGPAARWNGEAPAAVLRRCAVPGAVGALVVAGLGLGGASDALAVLACGLGAAALTSALRSMVSSLRGGAGRRRRRLLGGHLAHAGFALAAVGVAASSAWSVAEQATVRPGQSVQVGSTGVRLEHVDRSAGGGRMSTTAYVTVTEDGRTRGGSAPALAYFPGRDMTVTVPAVTSRLGGDVYVTLLAVAQDGSSATLRVTKEPLVWMLWAGGLLTVAGGAVAGWPSRPLRRRSWVGPAKDTVLGGQVVSLPTARRVSPARWLGRHPSNPEPREARGAEASS